MSKFLKKLPIRIQLFLLALSTGIVMFIIIFLIYFQVSKLISNYNTEYTNNISYQITQNISNKCDQLDRLLSTLAYNRTVQQLIVTSDSTQKYNLFVIVNNYFINLASMNEGIVDIAILNKAGDKVYFLYGDNEDVKKLIRGLPKNLYNYYTGVETINYHDIKRTCFLVVCDVNSILVTNATGENLGTAAIVINADALSLHTNTELEKSATKFFLLDRNNKIYSMSQTSPSEKNIEDVCRQYANVGPGKYKLKIDGKYYVVAIANIPEISGKIISVVPEDKLFSDLTATRTLIFTLFLLALAILSIPFMVITNNIVLPLKKFIHFFTLVKAKKLSGLKQRLDVDGYHEMVIMVREFNSLLDEIDSLTQKLVITNTKLYEVELEKKKSELSYLKSQINPHFLYNTLEVMKGSAIEEGAMKTSGMAKALAQIFRYSVKAADIVSLQEEVDIIKYYLYIQQARFNGRITVHYHFSEESLRCSIPQMILQPIAENAVFHGLEMKLGEGSLWFDGKIESNDLIIRIRDDGVGMDEETLHRLQEKLATITIQAGPAQKVSGGAENIGIMNVDNRIKLIYGEQYGITINSTLGQGTEVVIRLPARRN